jgi:hypothetical protein
MGEKSASTFFTRMFVTKTLPAHVVLAALVRSTRLTSVV